jgi:hypothetical protein
MRSFQERMSASGLTPTKARVQQKVREISTKKIQKSVNKPSTRQKLENFLTNFCKSEF